MEVSCYVQLEQKKKFCIICPNSMLIQAPKQLKSCVIQSFNNILHMEEIHQEFLCFVYRMSLCESLWLFWKQFYVYFHAGISKIHTSADTQNARIPFIRFFSGALSKEMNLRDSTPKLKWFPVEGILNRDANGNFKDSVVF